jgi:cell growth-regulating nucleolar protein
MTEDQKYQGALYKEKTKKPNNQNPKADNKQEKDKNMRGHQAFVEEVEEKVYSVWDGYLGATDDEKSPVEPPPEAPTPPSAANEDQINVFDFLVATGQTPNASTMNLAEDQKTTVVESTSLVRYEPKDEDDDDLLDIDDDDERLISYGSGPVPSGKYQTPANKSERRKSKEGEHKKDKKRKRLHVDVPTDRVMTDAPPVLHSGLTGGLKSLMRPVLPPSPDYSGGDGADPSPASPLKKTKHSKHSKHGHSSNSLFGMLAGGTKTKTKKHKSHKKHSHHKEDRASKLIEYRPQSKDGSGNTDGEEGQMILFKPRADVFLSFVNKGPESERGCSVNKALKRFHREREASGSNMGKSKEEKELWRSLRLRRNERGEIVLFSEEFDLAAEL